MLFLSYNQNADKGISVLKKRTNSTWVGKRMLNEYLFFWIGGASKKQMLPINYLRTNSLATGKRESNF